MSVTKLKTVGNWQGTGWQTPKEQRGRVITGMLSGGSLLQSTVEPAPRKTEK